MTINSTAIRVNVTLLSSHDSTVVRNCKILLKMGRLPWSRCCKKGINH
nr:hypothetical protein [Kibdelosporangium sp. MJ126-NF4]